MSRRALPCALSGLLAGLVVTAAGTVLAGDPPPIPVREVPAGPAARPVQPVDVRAPGADGVVPLGPKYADIPKADIRGRGEAGQREAPLANGARFLPAAAELTAPRPGKPASSGSPKRFGPPADGQGGIIPPWAIEVPPANERARFQQVAAPPPAGAAAAGPGAPDGNAAPRPPGAAIPGVDIPAVPLDEGKAADVFRPEALVWPDDVTLSGTHVASWKNAGGEDVLLFKGDFRFEVWKFRAESRDAVIWLRQGKVGDLDVVVMNVYLEGKVTVTGVEGTKSRSDRFLLTHVTRGRIIRRAETTDEVDAADDGVHVRGEHVRKSAPQRRLPGGAVLDVADDGAPIDEKAFAGDPGVIPADPNALPTPDKPDPVTRVVFDASDFELRSRGDQVLIILTGRRPRRPDGTPGPIQPVRIGYGDLELVADSMVLFSNKRLISAGGGRRAGERPDVAEGVYLEGDVQVASRNYSMRATRLYYDFGTRAGRTERGGSGERAILLDGVLRAFDESKRVPLWIRGTEIRLLARDDILAENAVFTTDDFNPPHFHLGAKRIHLWDLGVKQVKGTGETRLTGYFEAEDVTFNLRDTPFFWLPFLAGDADPRPEALRAIRFGRTNRLGVFGTTDWYLWRLLGIEPPIEELDATLSFDVFTKRGPSVGVRFNWQFDRSIGLFNATYLRDEGTDRPTNAVGNVEPEEIDRGRILFRNKKYFDEAPEWGITKGWELTTELSWLSDQNYLNEFGRFEQLLEKEQETLLYLKKKGLGERQNWAFHATLLPRILDFTTIVERLPELNVIGVGEPLTDWAVLHSDNRAGVLRVRTAFVPPIVDPITGDEIEQIQARDSDNVGRADTRQELNIPFRLGPVNFALYGTARLGGYTDGPEDGSFARTFGVAGIRATTHFHRTYDGVDSRAFDLHRLRHIIEPEINAWVAGTNRQPHRLFIYDYDVEGPGAQNGLQLALRQTFQTKRGGPGRRTTVDWLTVDAEAGFFSNFEKGFDTPGQNQFVDPENNLFFSFRDNINGTGGYARGQNTWYRPENSIPRNFASLKVGWRTTEAFSILGDVHWDLDDRTPPSLFVNNVDGDVQEIDGQAIVTSRLVTPRTGPYIDSYGLGVAFDHSPRYRLYLGYRRIEQLDAETVTGNLSYQVNEKYNITINGQYDVASGAFVRSRIGLTRRLPRFLMSFGLDFDRTRDNVGVFFNLVPEGFGQTVNNNPLGGGGR